MEPSKVTDEMVDKAIQYVLTRESGDWERQGDVLFNADANQGVDVRKLLEEALAP